MPEPAVIFENVTVELGGRVILDRLNGAVEAGVLTAVMGPNGAGKTTLLHAVLGLIPYRGRILFGPRRSEKRPRLGYVPQRLDLDRGSPITVRDFLAAVLTNRPLWLGIHRHTDLSAVAMLKHIGVQDVLQTPLGRLSGGETQRVLLAQALLARPEVLLLDEPAAAVDVAGEALFCDILDEVQSEMGITTLLVSHDLSVVTTHARNAICLNRELICSGPVAQVLTPDNLRRVFSPHIDIFGHHHIPSLPAKDEPDGFSG
ncbi:MAG: metal ABC transporter ATP-binding protein [Candidatus Zixiibacteriota bacterium]|nr:MAG: metal ABC transporter ATP-binding protein [candidate division Zixibacteria bacterium]